MDDFNMRRYGIIGVPPVRGDPVLVVTSPIKNFSKKVHANRLEEENLRWLHILGLFRGIDESDPRHPQMKLTKTLHLHLPMVYSGVKVPLISRGELGKAFPLNEDRQYPLFYCGKRKILDYIDDQPELVVYHQFFEGMSF